MSYEALTDREYSPQELINGLEAFLALPDEQLWFGDDGDMYAHVDVINRGHILYGRDGGRANDEFPFLRISKEILDGEVSYLVYEGSRYYTDYRQGAWRETKYSMRDGLYVQVRGRDIGEAANCTGATWETERELSRDELSDNCHRLLSKHLERRREFESRSFGSRLKRMAGFVTNRLIPAAEGLQHVQF